MRFQVLAPRIVFGPGAALDAVDAFVEAGRRPLLATGGSADRSEWLEKRLAEVGRRPVVFRVTGEPTLAVVEQAAAAGKDGACDQVIGLGGGAAVDAGKAVAALLTNDGDLLDYLEVIGGGRPLGNPAAPYLALPTTAGAGAEVTWNAVLASPEHGVKVSLRSPLMLPKQAVVDPLLTRGLSPRQTAASGMDALVQLIEAFISPMASPFTDGLCREAIPKAARALPVACQREDEAARADMSLAALFSGLALSHAKLGAVHGLAGTVGGMSQAPHGLVCARLLVPVLRAYLRVLPEGDPGWDRLREVAVMVAGRREASPEDGVQWLADLTASLPLGSLKEYQLTATDFPAAARQAQKSSSIKGSPVALSEPALIEALETGWFSE